MNLKTLTTNKSFTSLLFLVGSFAYCTSCCVASAQCTNEAPQGKVTVPPGTKVYYTLTTDALLLVTGPSTSPQTQIAQAFSAWSAANLSSGGDGTQFVPATASNPATITVTSDPGFVGGSGAVTSTPTLGAINSSNPATITLHPNAIIPDSSGAAAYQPSAPGYGTVWVQTMVHEIGHLMGFLDYTTAPATGPGASAMNQLTGVNGTGQIPPTLAPTPCDTQTAATYSKAILATPPLPGNGGSRPPAPVPVYPAPPPSGSGGGTGSNCTYSSYYDADNGIIYVYEDCPG
jgi:hypothetical protein